MTAVLFYWGDFGGHGTPASRGMRDPASCTSSSRSPPSQLTCLLSHLGEFRFLHFMPSIPPRLDLIPPNVSICIAMVVESTDNSNRPGGGPWHGVSLFVLRLASHSHLRTGKFLIKAVGRLPRSWQARDLNESATIKRFCRDLNAALGS